MNEGKAERPEFDPFGTWMQFTDRWMKSWSKVLSDTAASENYATAMGQQLEAMLETSKLFQQQMRASMEQYLQGINIATRSQVVSLAERMTHVEMRLDDLEAKMDESLDQLKRLHDRMDQLLAAQDQEQR
jgi:polyhydroxyalkanoic acid synthase PhaR subunit